MSARSAAYKFRTGVVGGSEAFELDDLGLWSEYGCDAPLDIPAAEQVEEEVVTDGRAISAQGVSPFAVVGFAVAAVLLVCSLLARIQLSELSDQCSALQISLTELSEQHSKLLIAYESAFNLTEIEDYAIGTLGMQKPRSDQVSYINTNSTDCAQVLDKGAAVGLADRIGDAVSSFLSYFTGGTE